MPLHTAVCAENCSENAEHFQRFHCKIDNREDAKVATREHAKVAVKTTVEVTTKMLSFTSFTCLLQPRCGQRTDTARSVPGRGAEVADSQKNHLEVKSCWQQLDASGLYRFPF